MVQITSRKGAWLNFFGSWRLDMTKALCPSPNSRTNTFWTEQFPIAFLLLRQNNGKRVPWNGSKQRKEVKSLQLTFCFWQSKPYHLKYGIFFLALVSFWEVLPWRLFTGHCRVVGVAILKKPDRGNSNPAKKTTKAPCTRPKNTDHNCDFTLLRETLSSAYFCNAVGQHSNSRLC